MAEAFSFFVQKYNHATSQPDGFKSFKIDDGDCSRIRQIFNDDQNAFLRFIGGHLQRNSDPFGNTSLTRLIANQRFGLVEQIIDNTNFDAKDENGQKLVKQTCKACGASFNCL